MTSVVTALVRAHDEEDASVRLLASECLNVVVKVRCVTQDMPRAGRR